LHDQVADAAGRRLHEHRLAGGQAPGSQQAQRQRRGHREHGRLGRVGFLRYPGEPVGVQRDQVGRRVLGQPGHPVAHPVTGHAVAGRHDAPDHVAGQGAG